MRNYYGAIYFPFLLYCDSKFNFSLLHFGVSSLLLFYKCIDSNREKSNVKLILHFRYTNDIFANDIAMIVFSHVGSLVFCSIETKGSKNISMSLPGAFQIQIS